MSLRRRATRDKISNPVTADGQCRRRNAHPQREQRGKAGDQVAEMKEAYQIRHNRNEEGFDELIRRQHTAEESLSSRISPTEIFKTKNQREQRQKKTRDDPWDARQLQKVQHTHEGTTRREGEREAEDATSNKDDTSPKLMSDTKPQIRAAQRTRTMMNANIYTYTHTRTHLGVSFSNYRKSKIKKDVLKQARGIKHPSHREE